MTFKCIHIADVHFRGLKRHDEYRKIFTSFFKKAKKLNPDIIYIGGDIVHSKTQGISPELIDILNWWFTSMAEICPVHVILGNHDGLILNKSRQDAITPIINALNNENIKLYKESGVYTAFETIKGQKINWCVFSCFDEENWSKVKPVENEINIACYHGAVFGSKTDVDWELEGEVSIDFFNDYHFAFLGDIHKKQYLDKAKTIAYPGSTVQQNYGEDIKKGFLFWEIDSIHDYKSKFISLENPYPFITIDWEGSVEDVIENVKKHKDKSRFRVSAKKQISQHEVKTVYELIKSIKSPTEIVFKTNPKNILEKTNSLKKEKVVNIVNDNDRLQFLNKYFSSSLENNDMSQQDIDQISNIFKKNLSTININTDMNNAVWSINKLEFNNVFSYGKNNRIDFSNLDGVVGIFGKNRSGKSSIPGTLMYTLYNTTDRGAMKNIHIINNRKGSCSANLSLTVNGIDYFVERKTIKNSTKKGDVWSSTSLNVSTIKNEEKLDQTEEQRRETEKVLRNIVGTSENFLYTSFASQGSINSFIKEKSSARKTILSNFLELNIYEELYKAGRDEYSYLKGKIKNISVCDWNCLINDAKLIIQESEKTILAYESDIKNIQNDLINAKVSLDKIKNNLKRHSSGYTLYEINNTIEYKKSTLVKENKKHETLINKKVSLEEKFNKFKIFKDTFSLEDLKREKDRLSVLSSKSRLLKEKVESALKNKERRDKKLKILDEVPCGDNFPSCKFIKDAYHEKNNSTDNEKEIKELRTEILEINEIIKNIDQKSIEENLEKYNVILNSEYRSEVDYQKVLEDILKSESLISDLDIEIKKLESIKQEIIELENTSLIDQENILVKEIKNINESLAKKELEKRNVLNEIVYQENQIKNLEKEKEEYSNTIKSFKLYDYYMNAVSKKGIPSSLIEILLPEINQGINTILSGITNFRVELEVDNNKSLEVYIDYGDSRRVIECGSGMEKMMTSIAIRAALVNITNLPRPNIFIIDEGFGALDESNIEACSRLLQNLKSYFKTILIISHVDEIKDVVDRSIKIETKGKDLYVNV